MATVYTKDLIKKQRLENLKKANAAKARKKAEAEAAKNPSRKRMSPGNLRFKEFSEAGIRRR